MFLKNKQGKLALIQPPNLPLTIFIVSSIIARYSHSSIQVTLFQLVATFSLVCWAYLEISHGDSQFRQVLGLTVMVLLIITRL